MDERGSEARPYSNYGWTAGGVSIRVIGEYRIADQGDKLSKVSDSGDMRIIYRKISSEWIK
jgi:hypothetical protein